jgi:hypothetical protein
MDNPSSDSWTVSCGVTAHMWISTQIQCYEVWPPASTVNMSGFVEAHSHATFSATAPSELHESTGHTAQLVLASEEP